MLVMEKKIKISSKPENITCVERIVDEICEECNIGKEVYGKILMATIEGVNNSIFHGNKLDEHKSVVVTITCDDDMVDISIEDEGDGFDKSKVPDPTLPDNIEEDRGRGVFLMDNLSDEIEYLNNGAKIDMKFRVN
jgi:serine/threonine-protein kinase RsbW